MNPWALLVIGLGVLLIIMGIKGSYGNIVSALTGHPYKPSLTAWQSTNPPVPQVTIPSSSTTIPGTTPPALPIPPLPPGQQHLGIPSSQIPKLFPIRQPGNIGQFFPTVTPVWTPWGWHWPVWKFG